MSGLEEGGRVARRALKDQGTNSCPMSPPESTQKDTNTDGSGCRLERTGRNPSRGPR